MQLSREADKILSTTNPCLSIQSVKYLSGRVAACIILFIVLKVLENSLILRS